MKRFIEETFPVKEVSEESAREKTHRADTYLLSTNGGHGDRLPRHALPHTPP